MNALHFHRVSDIESDATVAEYPVGHRFCIAPWLLPVPLSDPADILHYQHDEALKKKHDAFVQTVIEIIQQPETEKYVRQRLDVKDVRSPLMYWRLKALLIDGNMSEQLNSNGFLVPINNEKQKENWDELISDWLKIEHRPCKISRIHKCTSFVRRCDLIHRVAEPLLWVYAISKIRTCSMTDAEQLLSQMLD